jgi:hypothetical protein
MAAHRRAVEVNISRKKLSQLRSAALSRTRAAGRVARAPLLLAYSQVVSCKPSPPSIANRPTWTYKLDRGA